LHLHNDSISTQLTDFQLQAHIISTDLKRGENYKVKWNLMQSLRAAKTKQWWEIMETSTKEIIY